MNNGNAGGDADLQEGQARPDEAPSQRQWRRASVKARIAIVEDDPSQLALVESAMKALGFVCHCFTDGQDFLRAVRRETFDLLILDWQLPEITGPDIVLWVREQEVEWIPIIFVTNRRDERDVVRGFACGADDYMFKPMRISELVARVRALLRRGAPGRAAKVQQYGRHRFDAAERVVYVGDTRIELKAKEFALALCLFSNLGRLMSRQHLIEAVWGIGMNSSSRSLDTLIAVLRAKLYLRPQNGLRLSAEYGVGYRLESIEHGDAAKGQATPTSFDKLEYKQEAESDSADPARAGG